MSMSARSKWGAQDSQKKARWGGKTAQGKKTEKRTRGGAEQGQLASEYNIGWVKGRQSYDQERAIIGQKSQISVTEMSKNLSRG